MITGLFFLDSGWNFTQMESLSSQSSQPTQRLSKFYCTVLYLKSVMNDLVIGVYGFQNGLNI